MERPAGICSFPRGKVVHAAIPWIRAYLLLPSLYSTLECRLHVGLLRRSCHFFVLVARWSSFTSHRFL